MPVFPSIEWFDALRERANADPRWRALGTCDARVGIQVGEARWYEVQFEAFACTTVRAIGPSEAAACDFVLAMPARQWREMLEDIQRHGGASRQYTLNSLELPKRLCVRETVDIAARDKFYQYNQSLQLFFDCAAGLETVFAP